MMAGPQKIVPALVRGWVGLYTSGVPPDLRDERRAEIDADLWEHQRDATESGMPRVMVAVEMLLRTGLGIPDDIGWRLEAIKARRAVAMEGRVGAMALSIRQTRWMGLCGLLGGILWAASFAYGMPGYFRFYPFHIVVWLLFALGAVGLYLQQRGRAGKTALAGLILLLTGFLSMSTLNALGAIGVSGRSLVANILALAWAFMVPPGFLLLGIGMTGPARRVPLILGSWGVASIAVGFAGEALADSCLSGCFSKPPYVV